MIDVGQIGDGGLHLIGDLCLDFAGGCAGQGDIDFYQREGHVGKEFYRQRGIAYDASNEQRDK